LGDAVPKTSPSSRSGEEAKEGKRGDAFVDFAVIRSFDREWISDWMGGDLEFYCGSL